MLRELIFSRSVCQRHPEMKSALMVAEHPAEGTGVSTSTAVGWTAQSDTEMREGQCHSGPNEQNPVS